MTFYAEGIGLNIYSGEVAWCHSRDHLFCLWYMVDTLFIPSTNC